jgi:ribosome-associated protein
LLEALLLAQAIEKHHGAFKRQRKFIAKLLRDTDVAPIRAQLEQHAQVTAHVTRQVHVIERWRDRLLKGDDNDLNALMAEHPDADRQKLRQLIRDARKEHLAAQPPRSARLLFKYLRELMLVEEAGDEADEDYQEELP